LLLLPNLKLHIQSMINFL